MKITADTNCSHPRRCPRRPRLGPSGGEGLAESDLVVVPIPVLCEFVWVLRGGYKRSLSEVSDAIHKLMKSALVVMNRPAVEAGLAVLGAGGDFADGAIAYEGDWLGADSLRCEGCIHSQITGHSCQLVVIAVSGACSVRKIHRSVLAVLKWSVQSDR